jgi:hypothetical protein
VARAFDEAAERTTLRLPLLTKQQITALMLDLDLDLTETVVRAVSDLWQREIGTAEDVATVIGWHPYVPAQDVEDADGKVIPAGASAWREVWSDGRIGAVLSRVDDE